METKRAGDLMIHMDEHPHVPHTTTLRQAISEIENAEIDVKGRKSLPRVLLVLNDSGGLIGLIRRRDILRGLEPEYLSAKPLQYRRKLFDIKVDANLAELSFEQLIKNFHERAEKLVTSVMISDVKTVEYDDHITKIIYEMIENDVPLLPVLLNEKVVGVVRSVDVFNEIAKYLK